MKRTLIIISILLSLLTTIPAQLYANQYSITDLGLYKSPSIGGFGSTNLISYKINSSGMIVGHSPQGAFTWENGIKTELGNVYIGNINDKGQLTGGDTEGIYIWENGVKKKIIRATDLYYDHCYTYTFDISLDGKVVGMDRTDGLDEHHAYLWDSSNQTPPVKLIQDNQHIWEIATAINDNGLITFIANQSYLIENGLIKMLPNLNGNGSSAWDINNSAQIAGYSGHAVIWNNQIITDLGTLVGHVTSSAYAINEKGDVVGNSDNSSSTDSRAFFWNSETDMIDLNDVIEPNSGWKLTWASDINDMGWIVGIGMLNGENHGFLLKPILKCIEDDSGSIDIPSYSVTPGGTAAASVRMQNAPGNVQAMGFDITIPEGLTFKSFEKGLLVPAGYVLDVNLISANTLRCGAYKISGTEVIADGASGEIVKITFDVSSTFASPQQISLSALKDDIAAWTATPGCVIFDPCNGDTNNDGQITPADALNAFQKYMLVCPTSAGLECDSFCSDVNKDGMTTPGDALCIFRKYLNIPCCLD